MSLDDDEITNRSGNRTFREVLDASKSRRKVLTGGLGFAEYVNASAERDRAQELRLSLVDVPRRGHI